MVSTKVYQTRLLRIQMITQMIKAPHISETLYPALIIPSNLLITRSMRQGQCQRINRPPVVDPATVSLLRHRVSWRCPYLSYQGLYQSLPTLPIRHCSRHPSLIPR